MPSLQIMYRHYRSFHLAEKVNTFPSTPQCRMHFRTKSNFPKYPSLSAFAHTGLDELIECVIKTLDKLPKIQKSEIEEENIDKRNLKEFKVEKVSNNVFEVTGELVFEIMKRVNLEDMTSNAYFQKRIKNDGIIDALKEIGLQEGDLIRIGDYELQYFE